MPVQSSNDPRIPSNEVSEVAGFTHSPLSESSIGDVLRQSAADYSQDEAVVFSSSGERWTYEELDLRVDRFAAGLLNLGIVKGDRVAIWSPNSPEWLLTQFATARVGAILVNINPACRLNELAFALGKVGCRALITAESFKSSNYLGMLSTLIPELAQSSQGSLSSALLPSLDFIIKMGDTPCPGMLTFSEVLVSKADIQRETIDALSHDIDRHDAINIQFTSGTTGSPKGATLSHHNIVNNARNVVAEMNFTHKDRLCIPVPFYHCFGMVMGTLGCVSCGATMIIPSEGFDPVSTLKAIHDEQCTALYAVPTMFVSMLNHERFSDFNLSSLRTGIMAGAPCPIEVMKRVQSTMHMSEVTIAYGMTETSPVSFQSAVDDPLDKRVSSVGRVHPHVEVKIVNTDGNTVPVTEQGELCTRGYSVMKGYWDEPEQTAQCIDEQGWMHTGDLATLDREGYCNITGRLKDMIVRGGENIYPREVEEFLYRMPGVAHVQVFGVPDERLGETVCAWFVVDTGVSLDAASVAAFCADQIAHYKVPGIVELVDELPMTVTGKPQKFRMRQVMMEKLGLSEVQSA